MKQLTKKMQEEEAQQEYHAIVDPAYEAYNAIRDPAGKAYEAKIKEIYAQADKVEQIITKNGRQYKLIEENK